MLTRARLQVWGDPIAHSLSPRLHTAAYRALGLDWGYRAQRVGGAQFAHALAGLADDEIGLSLTMPLKGLAFAAADRRDEHAELTGAVNTLLRERDGLRGWNTDVGGVARDLTAHSLTGHRAARIVGAGATATSVLVALVESGLSHIEVVARRHEQAQALADLGTRMGVQTRAVALTAQTRSEPVGLTVATLPGGARFDPQQADALAAAGGTLYEVVYRPWPTDLARAFARVGRPVVRGIGMLTEQALLQVRAFVGGDTTTPLPDEHAVHAAMVEAVTDV